MYSILLVRLSKELVCAGDAVEASDVDDVDRSGTHDADDVDVDGSGVGEVDDGVDTGVVDSR